jgi:hypothetical protein
MPGAPDYAEAFSPLPGAASGWSPIAAHTHADAAEFLVTGKQAHYLFVVKGNQPALRAQLAALPWHAIPVADPTRDRGHGRVELRTLKVTRRVRPLASRRWRTVTVYAVASLTAARASPARLADYVRGHWGIEALHHVRDVTFAKDASQVRLHGRPIAVWCRRLDNSRARGTPWGQRFDHQAMAARCRHPAAAARPAEPSAYRRCASLALSG